MESSAPTREPLSRTAQASRLALLVGLLAALHFGSGWLLMEFEEMLLPHFERWGFAVAVLATLAYGVLLALPFVPGVEVGLAVMMLFGLKGVGIVYLATLLGLTVSFYAGQHIAPVPMNRLLDWLHLARVRALLERMRGLAPEERLAALMEGAPTRAIPYLLKHRYVALALLLNLPGNSVLGGGGGISLCCGLSHLFQLKRFMLLVAVATSPVPLIFVATSLWRTWV